MSYASRNGYVMSHMSQPLNGTSMNGLRLKVGLGLDVSLFKNYVESGLRRTRAISRARVDIQPTPQHNVTTGVARHHNQPSGNCQWGSIFTKPEKEEVVKRKENNRNSVE